MEDHITRLTLIPYICNTMQHYGRVRAPIPVLSFISVPTPCVFLGKLQWSRWWCSIRSLGQQLPQRHNSSYSLVWQCRHLGAVLAEEECGEVRSVLGLFRTCYHVYVDFEPWTSCLIKILWHKQLYESIFHSTYGSQTEQSAGVFFVACQTTQKNKTNSWNWNRGKN